MHTLLAKKSGSADNAIAKNDKHHELLSNDPSIPEFPKGNTFGTTTSSYVYGRPTAFGLPDSGVIQGSYYNATKSDILPNTDQRVLIQEGYNSANNADVLVSNNKESSDWINRKWRPAMGWTYMATCIADFIIFPILWSLLQAISKGQVTSQWQPLTLQGAGLYHMAMGAVLGIAAYGRTKEKIEGAIKN